MKQRLFWFQVKLSDGEVAELAASAARHGMIEPLSRPRLHPEGEERWIATDRGRELPFPKGSSFEDLGALTPAALERARTALSSWLAAGVAVLAAVGFGAAIGSNQPLAVSVGVFSFLFLLCLASVRAERDLAAAARVWPRFRQAHPNWWEWQIMPYRTEFLSTGILLAVGFFLATWVTSSPLGSILTWIGLGIIVVTGLVYVIRIGPLSRAWRKEAKLGGTWKERGRLLVRSVGKLRGLRWVVSSPSPPKP